MKQNEKKIFSCVKDYQMNNEWCYVFFPIVLISNVYTIYNIVNYLMLYYGILSIFCLSNSHPEFLFHKIFIIDHVI